MGSFWGAEVKPGQTVPFVPPPEGHRLHLSQVTLANWSTGAGQQRAAVTCKTDDCNPLRICTLHESVHECHNVDLVFDHYTEFQVVGAPVHLTGYHMPTHEELDEEEAFEDLAPEQQAALLRQQLAWEQGVAGLGDAHDDYDEDEDSDFSLNSDDEDEEEYDSDKLDSDDEPTRPSVIIEDVTGNGQLPDQAALSKTPEQNGSNRKGKRVRFNGTETAAQEGSAGPHTTASETSVHNGLPASHTQASKATPSPANGPSTAPAAADTTSSGKKKRKGKDDAGSTPAAKRPAQAGAGRLDAAAQQQPTESRSLKKAAAQAASAAAPAQPSGAASVGSTAQASGKKASIRRFENGFQVQDLGMGQPEGKLAKAGRKVVVKYTGQLEKTGKVFDQSKPKGFNFRLGVGEVIKGWDLGIVGMRVGDRRKLVIPPQLAYGTTGVKGAIPPNATLQFEVELLDVK